jgi:putative tryptophan/tyrosine transport system permease protein
MPTAVHTALQLGLLYGIGALAVVVSFRFLRFPDLTVDGSFVLGGALAAVLIQAGLNPWLAVVVAGLGGGMAGVCTSAWHRAFGVNKFFAGILSMMMLYSVNLRVLGGANLSLLRPDTVFGALDGRTDKTDTLIALVAFLASAGLVLLVFLSRAGVYVRAIGSNPNNIPWSRIRIGLLSAFALALANGLAGVAGALVAQYQSFADASMGLGVTVNLFAGVFLGEALLVAAQAVRRRRRTQAFNTQMLGGGIVAFGEVAAAGLGMIAFMAVTTGILYLGLEPSDTKAFAGLLLLAGLVWRRGTRSPFLVPAGEFER